MGCFLSDGIVVAGREVCVMGMKTLDPEGRTSDAARRTIRSLVGHQGITLCRIPSSCRRMTGRQIGVGGDPGLGFLDPTARLDPSNPARRQRTGQPIPGWKRRPIVEQRRNGNHHRDPQMTTGPHVDDRSRLAFELSRDGGSVRNAAGLTHPERDHAP